MTGDALTQEQQDALWQQAEEQKKAGKTVRRKLIGGPLNGQEVIIPETQQTNDVGWWTMHYRLTPEGEYAGMMVWGRKE